MCIIQLLWVNDLYDCDWINLPRHLHMFVPFVQYTDYMVLTSMTNGQHNPISLCGKLFNRASLMTMSCIELLLLFSCIIRQYSSERSTFIPIILPLKLILWHKVPQCLFGVGTGIFRNGALSVYLVSR